MKWNEAQLQAITTRDHNILVSASAGSGKTTVLVERLIRRILDDHVPITHILAMTYTDAAAGEMKKRLAAKLQEKLNETKDESIRSYIQEQLSQLADANISTIHSFCLSIVKKFYYFTDLNPKQFNNILDGSTSAIYEQTAMDHMLSDYLQKNDTLFFELCEMFSPRAESFEALKQAVAQISEEANAAADANAFYDMCISYYQPVANMMELPKTLRDHFFDHLTTQMQIYESILQKLSLRFLADEEKIIKKRTLIEQKINQIHILNHALSTYDYETFRTGFIDCAKLILPTNPDKINDKEYSLLREQAQKLEDQLLADLLPQSELYKQMDILRPYVKKLIEMTKVYQQYFQMEKQKQFGMDFHDMEAYAIQLLKEHEEVRQYYQHLFEEIMVDEFQDANDVQNVLVSLIARENNVFRVGDIKQSIYGFRHAKPSIMRNLIINKKKQDTVIYLSNNYRSKQSLIDFNNAFYEELMNIEQFTPAFHQEDVALGGTDEQQQNNQPIVFHQLMLKELAESLPYNMSGQQLKADYIAKTMIEMKTERNIRWKDFVVLARSNSVKEEMKKAFLKYNIPFFIDARSGFYDSPAVSAILSYLYVCVNPYDNLHLVAVLSSPLFEVNHETLAQIQLNMRKEQITSYYVYLKRHPISKWNILEQHLQQIQELSLQDLLNELYLMNDFYRDKTNVQEKTNLDLLYEMACTFEQKEGYGIHGFLRYVRQAKEQESAEALPIGSEANVVRVMSIHQSKGLQFPIVFLWSGSSFSTSQYRDFLMVDHELGIGLQVLRLPYRFKQNTLIRMAMEHKQNKEELEEEMRILYVATTRAQNEMHIVDTISDKDKMSRSAISAPFLYERKGYTSWLLSASRIPVHLYHTKTISTYWSSPQNVSLAKHTEVPKLVYDRPSTSYSYLTPTQAKSPSDWTLHLDSAGMRYGTIMHACVEELGKLPWDKESIQTFAKKKQFEITNQMNNTLLVLSNDPIFQMANQMPEVYHEVPFAVMVNDTLLHGTMDFMAKNDNELMIIDFKSDHVDATNILIERYHTQMEAYINAMKQLYPQHHITCFIYSFHLSAMIQI